MRIIRNSAAAAGLLALAACGGGGEGKSGGNEAGASDPSANAASAADGGGNTGGTASAAMQLQPGQWEMTTQTVNVSIPGLPAGAADMMKTGPITVKTCITEEQAQKPSADLFAGKTAPNCKQEGFTAAGGKVNGTMTCSGGDTGATAMKMEGQFGPTQYDITMATKTQAEGRDMTMEIRSSGRRLGECPAGAKAG